MNELNKKEEVSTGQKKQYQSPCLRVYGDIRVLTQSAGSASMHRDVAGMVAPLKTK